METIIYRRKTDNHIYRIELAENYVSRGMSIELVRERCKTYNSLLYTAEMHDVADSDEELIRLMAAESSLLFAEKTIHQASEYIPNNTYIYVFKKHEGHDTLTIDMIKVKADNVQLPTIHGERGVLPIAWCRAKDLSNLLGFTKRDINRLTEEAKSMAWPWYKD